MMALLFETVLLSLVSGLDILAISHDIVWPLKKKKSPFYLGWCCCSFVFTDPKAFSSSWSLERPSPIKVFLYAKSLTSEIPFPNARDSLGTLCNPIVDVQEPPATFARLHAGLELPVLPNDGAYV